MNTIFSLLLWVGLSSALDPDLPDLKNKEDLKSLGIGRIIEKDNSIISKVTLFEIHEYWIVYLKDESLHEISMDDMKRMEFKKSKWGSVEITFPENKPHISVHYE